MRTLVSPAAEKVLAWLNEQGYETELDEDGDIRFRRELWTYLVVFESADPIFIRVLLPAFWRVDGETEREQALLAANAVTAETKVAKVYLRDDAVFAAVELFYAPPEAVVAVLERALDALHAAVFLFVNIMQGHRGPAA